MKNLGVYLALLLALILIYMYVWDNKGSAEDWEISRVIKEVEKDNVQELFIQSNSIKGSTKAGKVFKSYLPGSLEDVFGKVLYKKIVDNKIITSSLAPQTRSILSDMLPMVFTIVIFAVIWFVFMQNSGGGGSKAMSFGKSKARLHKADKSKKVTFSDVAGLKEEKEELQEIVDFLKNPAKYRTLGARIPKGVLMVGRPGTGKTYLTRAVAGEAGVPFFSISGSDFVEMFVGVGASRVRDMFETAKKNSPCIIFIDEIDAVGRRRGAGLGGGHDEREQTLNQLLVEMDGFADNQGIIIIAATNRPDILDPALLRPGRFDRQIMVGLPDIVARQEILEIHAKNKPISEHVDFKTVARGTPGFTPADLENVLNESAILAARKSELQITMKTIEEATTKVIAGVEKKSRVVTEKERKLTAYHEGGHAVLGKLVAPEDPVHQVTIIPRGRAGGFTLQLPTEDRSYMTKTMLESEIMVLLGGRLAEKIILKDISTGASNDLERVTAIARDMVTKYAMSDNISVMSYSSEDDEVFLGRSMGHTKQYSEQVQAEIDREVRAIVDTLYAKAESLLREHIDKLHNVAAALLEFETIYNEEFEAAFDGGVEAVKAVREKNKKQDQDAMKEYAEKKKKEDAERLLGVKREKERLEREAELRAQGIEPKEADLTNKETYEKTEEPHIEQDSSVEKEESLNKDEEK